MTNTPATHLEISPKDFDDLKKIVEALVAIDCFPNLSKWICDPKHPEQSGHDENELFAPVPFVDWCHGNIFQEKELINDKDFYSHCSATTQLIVKFLTRGDIDNDVAQERIDLFSLATLYPIHLYVDEKHKGKPYYHYWVVQLKNCAFYFADNNLYKEGE